MGGWRLKMNQKGVAAAAVAVVVIIIAVAGVGAFLLLRGGGALGTVPVYPSAHVEDVDVAQYLAANGLTLPAGWSGKLYTTQASPENVISWYRSNMPGWTNVVDNTWEYGDITYYGLGYRKGNDAAMIVTATSASINCLVILAGPAS